MQTIPKIGLAETTENTLTISHESKVHQVTIGTFRILDTISHIYFSYKCNIITKLFTCFRDQRFKSFHIEPNLKLMSLMTCLRCIHENIAHTKIE